MPSLTNFTFQSPKHQEYKTFITQEMLKKNFLATNTIYPCTKHNDRFIEMYLDNLDKILKIISYCENNDQDINKYLDNKVSKKDFYRYN